jgi:hypothetical protein
MTGHKEKNGERRATIKILNYRREILIQVISVCNAFLSSA